MGLLVAIMYGCIIDNLEFHYIPIMAVCGSYMLVVWL